ncbi:MAG TPA: urease accessory protein UreH [Terriglobia bacterium]|nr:urease accessory protein UreH [Terriglobia bacterium]
MKSLLTSNLGTFPIWATLALGFVLGLRHALDADHLAAVSTFVSEEKNILRSSLIGVYWGLGHTFALLVFGVAIAAFRLTVPQGLSQLLEFLVGCMLILLGANVIRKLFKGQTIHIHTHEHDGSTHSHLHLHLGASEHSHRHHVLRVGGRPFVVGVVHGLAGTAAIMLLIVGAIPSLILAVGYILVFGIGSIGGMMLMSMLMSVPLALATRRLMKVERWIRLAAGLFSLGFGTFLAWDVGLIQSLLR